MKSPLSMAVATVVALLVSSTAAHGSITSPTPRQPGPKMAAACGQAAVNSVQRNGDIPLESVASPAAGCQLNLCRGAVFEDNQDLLQTFQAGEVVNMKAQLPIPHNGPMNVSIVSTATNSILKGGANLIAFASYANEKLATLPANNTAFSVTIPTNLAKNACTVPGECVLQWFWFGTQVRQTYESCVDFVLA